MAPAALGEGESRWPRAEQGTPTPRRRHGVPSASAGGERGSSAPPPIRRRGKEVEKCPHRHSAPASRQRRLRTFERPGLPVQTGDAAPKWSVRRSVTSAASASPPAGRRRLRTDAAPSGLHPPLGSCDNGRHALACWLPALSQGPAWPACPALSASMQISFEMQVVGSEAPDPGPGGTGLKS